MIRLAEEGNLYKLMNDEQKDFLDIITPLNIEARYPTQKKQIFEALNQERCNEIIIKTEEVVSWIRQKLEN